MNHTSLNHFLIIIGTIGGTYAYSMRDQLGSDVAGLKQSVNSVKMVLVETGERLHLNNNTFFNVNTLKRGINDKARSSNISFLRGSWSIPSAAKDKNNIAPSKE
jgi:hypothetical protein